MSKKQMRKIVVDGETYLWTRRHFHLTEYTQSRCVEKLNIHHADHKRSPLLLRFREEDNQHRPSATDHWYVGSPGDGGIFLLEGGVGCHFCLDFNRPRVIAAIIRLLRATLWNPATDNRPCEPDNALLFLDQHRESLRPVAINPIEIHTARLAEPNSDGPSPPP